MKYNKTMLGAGALAMLLAVGVAATASAYQGDYTMEGPDCTPEKHEVMEEAFNTGNYDTWAEQMTGKGRVTQVVNEGNFVEFAKAHSLGQAGDKEGANEIRSTLGLRTSDGERVGAGYGKGQGAGDGQGSGKMNSENRGQNKGGKFVDADSDGNCDNL